MMGQPIKLWKGKEALVVYGRAQAAVHLSDGWQEGEPPAPKPRQTATRRTRKPRKPAVKAK